MRIGELAQRAGVTARTIRYYESLGLIPLGAREGNGHHHYPEQTLARLEKIDQLKQLGLSLDEVRGVIDLYFSDPTGRGPKRKVLALLRQHLAQSDQQLTALKKFRSELQANIQRFEDWLQRNE